MKQVKRLRAQTSSYKISHGDVMYSIGDTVNIIAVTLYDQSIQLLSHVRPQEPQHTSLPCPLPTPGVYSNSCPLTR